MATITRSEVARMLGISVATVRRMEGKSLHPKLVDGAWRFEGEEVTNVQRAPNGVVKRMPSEGEIAAEVFRRFDEHQSLRQIVRECCLPPKVVRNLHDEWATLLGDDLHGAREDQRSLAVQEERDLAHWESEMRTMAAAEERYDLRESIARSRQKGRQKRRTEIFFG